MLEFLINPKKAERKPWEMLFVGFFYALISVLLCAVLFYKSAALEKYSSIFMITFTIMFTIPFMYYTIRLEEKKDIVMNGEKKLLREHGRALSALLFLFLGFIIAFSLAYILMPKGLVAANFKAQVESYCAVNARSIEQCSSTLLTTGASSVNVKNGMHTVSSILSNNFFVMITTLIFSFLFGAGAIFILAWNASVIAAAIGIFSQGSITKLPMAFVRYLIHGIPEIAAYFVIAMAGGILSTAIIKHEFGKKKFWKVLQDSLDLIILALVVLIVAAFIEAFVTPVVMSIII